MTTKVLKFQSDQAGPFDVQNNKVDIVIPGYIGYSDLSRSCIIIDLKLKNKTGAEINGSGLADQCFAPNLDTSCLIKNCSITSDNVGVIEDIPALNVLNANLRIYTRDFEDNRGDHTYGYGSQEGVGTFLRKRKLGSIKSTQQTYLQIELSKLFGIGRAAQFPNGMLGNCKIHLEFEDDTVNIVPKLFKFAVDPTVYTVTNTSNDKSNFQYSTRQQQAFNLYVGQSVTVTDADGGNAANQTIGQINYDASNNQADIVLSSAAGTTPVKIKANNASGIAEKDLRYEIASVKLKLYQYMLTPSQQSSLNGKMKRGLDMSFLTYSLERVNLNDAIVANSTYDRQFDIEPNCMNAMAITPLKTSANPFIGRQDNLQKYRWRLNDIDTTDRDVEPYKSLYHDRLMATLSSGVYRVKNLHLNREDIGTNDAAGSKSNVMMIPQPVPVMQNRQVLQLRTFQNDAESTSGRTLHLYKQVQKAIKLRGSQVMVV